MEDEYGIEGAEFGSHDAEVQSDDDGVEYHAKFEDQKRGDLLLECEPAGFRVNVFDCFGVSHLVVLFRAGKGCLRSATRRLGFRTHFNARNGALNVLFCAHTVLDLNVAFCAKAEEENHHHGGEDDGRTPGVLGPSSRHAHAGVGSDLAVCGIEEMNEGGGDDDTGAKVACEEVDVERDAETGNPFGDDGEERGTGGYDHNDEEGGYPRAELAVVFIAGGGKGADDITRVGGCEVDVGRVEVGVTEIIGGHFWVGC